MFLESHEPGQSLSRFATEKPEYRQKAAKVLAVLMRCLSSTSQDEFTFIKTRSDPHEKLLVFLNFSDDEQPLHYPTGLEGLHKELLVSNVDEVGQYLSPVRGENLLGKGSVIKRAP